MFSWDSTIDQYNTQPYTHRLGICKGRWLICFMHKKRQHLRKATDTPTILASSYRSRHFWRASDATTIFEELTIASPSWIESPLTMSEHIRMPISRRMKLKGKWLRCCLQGSLEPTQILSLPLFCWWRKKMTTGGFAPTIGHWTWWLSRIDFQSQRWMTCSTSSMTPCTS